MQCRRIAGKRELPLHDLVIAHGAAMFDLGWGGDWVVREYVSFPFPSPSPSPHFSRLSSTPLVQIFFSPTLYNIGLLQKIQDVTAKHFAKKYWISTKISLHSRPHEGRGEGTSIQRDGTVQQQQQQQKKMAAKLA